MKMKEKCVLALVVYLALLFGGCSLPFVGELLGTVAKPTVEGVHPRITGLDFKGINLAFDVDIKNPYSVPIKSPKFKYGLDISNEEFLASEEAIDISLPARNVGTATLPVRLTYTDLWQGYRALRDAEEVPYNLRGSLVLPVLGRNFELPLSKSGKFPVLRVPKFSNVEVKVPKLSFDGASIAIKADMKNPNIFALGIEKLGYVLKSSDTVLGALAASSVDAIEPGETQPFSFEGEFSALPALANILSGKILDVEVVPVGSLNTPYGVVELPGVGGE